MRALVPLVFPLALLPACSGADLACTAIGSRSGVSVEVDPAVAPKVDSGTLELCWDGRCRTLDLELYPSTAAGETTCAGEVCSAQVRQTGGKHAFGDVLDLPLTEIQATLRLTGTESVTATLPLTPEQTYPNGPGCGAGSPQQRLVVEASGTVRAG
ncbi:hypothetical protein [Amycolatopsis magusensis]|uniref:Secreted protein n=1 Tax=Amycolatopsis magusensis TaxID=882444 RepID=A0ABS4PJ29_9PSEU|nr:hypothetical protein [Amycolatopsis magusensis]MBP2179406.1 hypothetical protein [Amycolatopsis magusensis]